VGRYAFSPLRSKLFLQYQRGGFFQMDFDCLLASGKTYAAAYVFPSAKPNNQSPSGKAAALVLKGKVLERRVKRRTATL